MDFKQLETLVYVAKYKSFSKAAKELFLTQPTVSNHIQNLENELGTVLINRNNKGISLTKSGKILYDYALEIMSIKQKALYSLGEYSGKIEGVIEISSSSIPSSYIVPEILKSFSCDFPYVKYILNQCDSHDIIESIIQNNINFGFVGGKVQSCQIDYIDLIGDELVLIAPYNYKINHQNGYINIEDIKKEKLIMRKEGSSTRNLIVSQLDKHNISLDSFNIIAHAENSETVKKMVMHGLGVSIISNKAIIDEINFNLLKSYKIKDLNLKRRFYLAYTKTKPFTPLEKKFIDHVIDFFSL
ncbi:DNA-binding transcriptional regulator, LysR family [Alkalithermobacter thermoalcaliphilus JW-YL-7 = DSM 7308]|uniref:Transcriptional regulator, LysR family n=1 Tax=Alkalithermobacter thermoalcaliphilus JW-YL-7 = DSM 7308 TaxID=1121328 RepID=A0A150FRD8_CLOPD|nr:transcriptional regulator, LysR family [[Clostridium] paradoxum JW-YL-7 = DSM 7308]SHK43415.1 DNA-binding transcriptional regulator, LysR family [[Clostridium] paradoxum JW-YL-7 = DSM 7308]